jgi:uncharacterized membrane protein
MAAGNHVNIHGRKGGRGIRPWLLIPKYLCVSVYLGSLVVIAALLGLGGGPMLDVDLAVRVIAVFVTIPAGLMSAAFGVLLLLQHPQAFLRMRWMQAKLLVVFLVLPGLELFGIWYYRGLVASHDTWENGQLSYFIWRDGDHELRWVLAIVLATIGVAISAIILGRLKPRLGQRVKTMAEQRAAGKGEAS